MYPKLQRNLNRLKADARRGTLIFLERQPAWRVQRRWFPLGKYILKKPLQCSLIMVISINMEYCGKAEMYT